MKPDFYRNHNETPLAGYPWAGPDHAKRAVIALLAGAAILFATCALAQPPYDTEDATIYEVDEGVRVIEYDSGSTATCYDLGDGIVSCEGDRNVTCYEVDSGVVTCEEQ